MRRLRLAAPVAAFLTLVAQAQTPIPPPANSTQAVVPTPSAPVAPTVSTVLADDNGGAIAQWRELAFHSGNSSARIDFLYWATMRTKERGTIFAGTITDNNGNDSPSTLGTGLRPDLEMGVRATYAWPRSELWSFEVSGQWVHNFDYPYRVQAGTFSNGPNNTVTSSVALIPNNSEDLRLASSNYQYKHFGFESNARGLLVQGGRFALDGIFGMRYINHTEHFDSRIEVSTVGQPIFESFKKSNNYFGPQLGVEARYAIFDYVSLKGVAKTVFSVNMDSVRIYGPTDIAGRFTAGSNRGADTNDAYAQLWDLGFGLVVHLTPNIHLHGMWENIYLDRLARATDQIDMANIASGTPQALHRRSPTWIGGWTLGLEVSY